MDKRNITQQTEILNQISKVSDAIRQKYKILKVGKDSSEQAANEIFKPVVTPLQALVENSKAIKYELKQEEDSHNYSLKKPEISAKKRISDLESSDTLIILTLIKDFDHIDPVIIIDTPKKRQKIETVEEIEKILKRITTIENIIRELDAKVATSHDIIEDQQGKIDKLEHRVTNLVRSILRNGEIIKEIRRITSDLDKK